MGTKFGLVSFLSSFSLFFFDCLLCLFGLGLFDSSSSSAEIKFILKPPSSSSSFFSFTAPLRKLGYIYLALFFFSLSLSFSFFEPDFILIIIFINLLHILFFMFLICF